MGYLNETGPSDCEDILREIIRTVVYEKADSDIHEFGTVSEYWEQAVADHCKVDIEVAYNFFDNCISATAVESDNPELSDIIDQALLDAEELAQEREMDYGQLSDNSELSKLAYLAIPDSLPLDELELVFSVNGGVYQPFNQFSDLIDEYEVEDW